MPPPVVQDSSVNVLFNWVPNHTLVPVAHVQRIVGKTS